MLDFKLFNKRIIRSVYPILTVGSGHQEGVKIQEKEHGTGVFFPRKTHPEGRKVEDGNSTPKSLLP